MPAIRLSVEDVGLIITLLGQMKAQADAGLPKDDYVFNAVRESIVVKAEMIEKVINGGVIEK